MNDEVSSWKRLIARAVKGGPREARYMQLATVDATGKPHNRTVVFRGFLPGTDRPTFTTDARSQKIDQITKDPRAELCWYFATVRQQFRLSGSLKLVGPQHRYEAYQRAREVVWARLSEGIRRRFAWPHPLRPRSDASEYDVDVPGPGRPLANFRLVIMDVSDVDHLNLATDPHQRTLYTRRRGGDWVRHEVNP